MVKKIKRGAPAAPAPASPRRAPAPAISHAARRAKFVAEYLKDHNATQAAKRAGYSAHSAHAQGYRLLRDAEIAAAIANAQQAEKAQRDEIQAAAIDRYAVTTDRITRELALIGFSNMADYVDMSDGTPRLDLSEVTRDQAAAINEVNSVVELYHRDDGTVQREIVKSRIKLAPKREALVDLGKITGMFKDGVDVSVPVRFIITRTDISKEAMEAQEA